MYDKRFTVRPQIEVNLLPKDIDDIMFTALEDGITSWCCRTKVSGDCLGKYASDQISRGGSLILCAAESSDRWELTQEKFLNGVRLYFENGCHVRVEDGFIVTCDITANDADCIVQFALFGEVQFR